MNQKGLTLIELAIVLAIVAVIAAVAIPKYTDLTGQAGDAAVFSMSGSVLSAYAIAVAQNAGVPSCAQVFGRLGLTGTGDPPTATVTVGSSTTFVQCSAADDEITIWNNKAATHNSASNGLVLNLEVN